MYIPNLQTKFDWRLPLLFLLLLSPVAAINFVLFHTIIESVAAIVAMVAFVVAVNTYPFSQSHFLLFLSCGYFWVGVLDMFHVYSYASIPIFKGLDSEPSAQFELAARLLEASILLLFTSFATKPIKWLRLFLFFAALSAITVTGVLYQWVMPVYDAQNTMTTGKMVADGVVLLLLALAGWRLWLYREHITPSIYRLFIGALVLTASAQLLLLIPGQWMTVAATAGHICKLLSFWLIYLVVVGRTLTQPFKSLSLSTDTFNALPDAICVVSSEGKILHANDPARHLQLTGQGDNDLIDADVHQRFHQPDISAEDCLICQSLKNQQPLCGHQIEVAQRWFEVSLSLIHHGHDYVLLQVCRDITVRKEALVNFQTANRLYTVLRLTNKAIISAKNRNKLLDSVCDIAVNHGGFAMAWIGVVEQNTVVPISSNGGPSGYLKELNIALDGSFLAKGPVGLAFEHNKISYVNNIETDPRFAPWRDRALHAGFRSMAAIPVRQQDKCVGVFVIYADCFDAFDSQTLELLSSLRDDISGAITFIEAEEKRLRAEAKLMQLSQAVEQSQHAIVISDIEGKIEYVNSYYSQLTGYDGHDVMGKNLSDFIRLDNTSTLLSQCLSAVRSGGKWSGEVESLKKNGDPFWSMESVSPIVNQYGVITNIVWTTEDSTELHDAHETISKLAYFDPLTGLPNRKLYYDRFNQAINTAKRHKNKVAILCLDLDNFKMVNESWGHDFGDLLLKHVSKTLTGSVRAMDTVARLGGDEFSIIITDVYDINHIANVADHIIQNLNLKTTLDGRELSIEASIGICVYPNDGDNTGLLTKNADMAMYHAKERGKNTFQYYQAFLNVNAQQRLEMESKIKYALANDEFELFYQPQFDVASGSMSGVEALIRWPDGEQGYIPPDDFIPIAEQSALIIYIGNWVVRRACHEFKDLIDHGLPGVKVAVNISANQFRQSRLLMKTILEALGSSELPPHLLQLEITEGVLVDEVDETIAIIEKLKNHGVTFAIDDFGTGYSSLSYLKTFPVDIIKIDRSFIHDMENNSNDQAIIRAISVMAHELDLKVLAEGVENASQVAFLREHQCDIIQGFYYAKPMSAADLLARFGTKSAVPNQT